MAKDSERRRYVRLAADDNITCSIAGTGVVHLVGMGSQGHGMRIITDKELPDGEQLTVDITVGQADVIKAQGRVVWQETWDFGFCNRHVAGVSFTEIDEESRQKLIALIPPEDEREAVPDEEL